jgi:flagellar biogenesis protein FliO
MHRALAILLGVLLAAPAAAEQSFVDISTGLTDEAFEIRLAADGPIGSHRVQTTPGFVRVWFHGMEDAFMDHAGGGRITRWVRLRPGAPGMAVAIVRLGDPRRLSAESVSVVNEGETVRVLLDRAALDGLISAPAAEAPEPGAEEAEAAEAAAGPVADAPVEGDGQSVAEATAATGLAMMRPVESDAWANGAPVTLFFLTLFLAGAYLAVRLWARRRGPAVQPPIEVVASRRIGTRHQLLVVRALGEDHLLSIQGSKTEKLASTPAPPGSEKTTAAMEEDLVKALGVRERKRAEERPRFGSDLLRLAGERTRGDRVSVTAGSSTPTPSEAVAGLLRLRERLGR